MTGAYYNEFDPKAAAWLRELIKRGLIADGEVDERDLWDVTPDDIRHFTQVHLCAGIGVWSYALRSAGWPDDRPVWTASFPCQPFSAAGKGKGFADERHLWPAGHFLIEECRPPVVFGEQVASKDGLNWLDLVQADLEGTGYAVGAVDTCAAGFGAPHIRQRLYWAGTRLADASLPAPARQRQHGWKILPDAEPEGFGVRGYAIGSAADASSERLSQQFSIGRASREAPSGNAREAVIGTCSSDAHGMADADGRNPGAERQQRSGEQRQQPEDGGDGGMADADNAERRADAAGGHDSDRQNAGWAQGAGDAEGRSRHGDPGPINGRWRDADWLFCRDGKWRPVEARPQQMVDGSAGSLGRVRNSSIAELQEEIDAWSVETKSERAASLRVLRQALGAQAGSIWSAGRLPGLHEAPFLLAFLRQLEEQGWAVPEGVALSCSQAAAERLRVLRIGEAATGPSRERGLVGQPAGEPADAVHLLSSLLARHAYQAWGDAYSAHAEVGFPLGRDSVARVGRLRGYGNAIVAPVAQAFIESYMMEPS